MIKYMCYKWSTEVFVLLYGLRILVFLSHNLEIFSPTHNHDSPLLLSKP